LAVGEKVDFRRFAVLTPKANQVIGSYIHMGGKISVAVLVEGGDQDFANQFAMHIAANSPLYVELKDVPADESAREKAVALEEVKADPKLANKPDAVKDHIVEAKVDKVLGQSCLCSSNTSSTNPRPSARCCLKKARKSFPSSATKSAKASAKDPSQEN
jgi:elongation factor Ts